ncbi:MAG: septation protein IspZ [Immundisolibacteraceae bacterium]|nr:septation protein IspZ [Immundisolibacteraceae bacterium]
MQVLLDFFPVIIFFVAYKLTNIYVAVSATAVASLLTFAITWAKTRKIQNLQLVSLIIILIAAGLTLFFRDDTFIKWKPTIINGLFAIVFAISLFSKIPLAERLFGTQITCPRTIWTKLTVSWTVFFLVCAASNYYVAFVYQVDKKDLSTELQQNWQKISNDNSLYSELILKKSFSELLDEEKGFIDETPEQRQATYLRLIHQERWVNFKLFGLLILTLVFVIGQGLFLSRHIQDSLPQDNCDQPDSTTQPSTE